MMKKSLLKDLMTRLTGGVAVAFLAMGVFGSPPALAGIASTKHNLGSDGTGTNKLNAIAGSTEICVFCHTPHGADTGAAVPLWNKNLVGGTPAVYLTYNSLGTSSLDGAMAPVGSVSLACLSCHDGTQAMNVMINAPGSGGYNDPGIAFGTMTGANQTLGKLNAAAGITLIGEDLKNDHPISIQYAGGPSGASIPAAGSDYTGFKDPDFNTAKSASLNGTQVWWVDSGTVANTRDKADMQLYTRTPASYNSGTSTIASTTTQPFVECASCHDPHNSTNATFLRIANTGSAVCLACHIK